MNTKDIKRRVTAGRTASQLEREPAQLALAEIGGTLWASNRYWVTPAARVTALLTEYNLPADPGLFVVNGTVRVHPDGVNVEAMTAKTAAILDLAKYTVPAAPVLLGGHAAHVPFGKDWRAVYLTASGDHLGLPADDLAWLRDTGYTGYGQAMAELIGLDTRGEQPERLGEVRVLAKPKTDTHTPVLLAADAIRTVKPACYGPGDDGPQTYHAAETENLGPRVLGCLMAAKLGG
jgi:hypothetical protein